MYLIEIEIKDIGDGQDIFLSSFLLGTRQDSTDLLAVLILIIWGTHWPTSVFEYYRQAVPLLGRMPHSPYYFFRGGVHISLLCPPSTCVCMCAVNAGGCVIDPFVQGWASTSSLLCLVTVNSANTDNSPVPPVPFVYPRIRLGGLQAGDEKSPQILSHFSN